MSEAPDPVPAVPEHGASGTSGGDNDGGEGGRAADPARLCEEARALAEHGDSARAAALFERVLDLGGTPYRAQAALGLAVVLDDAGDTGRARDADRAAIATGDPEYGPRAAYHLALTHERAGEHDLAAPAWRVVVDFGNPAYLPPAHLALARLADDAGDFGAARGHWEAVLATGDAEHGPPAAHDLAQRHLERGDPVRAQRVLTAGLKLIDRAAAPYAHARLAVTLGIACLDQAAAAFGAALGDSDEPADPEAGPLATELLARTLPLRGRDAEAREVWRRGLADPGTAAQVRARLRRGFGGDEEDADPADLWWDPVVEQAVTDGTLPALAGEAFGALDHMYALLAARYAGEPRERPGGPGDLIGRALGVPGDYPWGPLLQESFAERLRLASDPADPVDL